MTPRAVATLLLRIGVSMAACWVLVRQIRVEDVALLWVRAEPSLIALSFALLLGRIPLAAHRWRMILARQGWEFSTANLTQIVLESQFFATLLPGNAGSDLARGHQLVRRNVTPRSVWSAVAADRVAGLFSTILLAVVPAGWMLYRAPELWPVSLTVFLLLAVAIAAARYASVPRRPPPVGSSGGLGTQLAEWVRSARAEVSPLLGDEPLVLRVVGLSVAFQLAGIVATYLLGRAVGAEAGVDSYLLFLPMIWLWTSVPVSIGGIGVREGGFVFYFGLVGMPREVALAIALLVLAQSVLLGLLGGLLILARGLRRALATRRGEGRA